jgi:hypothetical protein
VDSDKQCTYFIVVQKGYIHIFDSDGLQPHTPTYIYVHFLKPEIRFVEPLKD